MKSFELAGVRVAPGTMARVTIPLAKNLVGHMQPLSVFVAHGTQPGPVLSLSAAIHGNELNGIPIIRQLLWQLEPRRMRGTVIAVPVVNVFGFNQRSRYLPDNRDLNRCFPGSSRGSLGARIAHHFLSEVISRSSHAVDFHTAAEGRDNWPQIRCNLDEAVVAEIAEAFAAPATLHAPLRDGSLRGAAGRLGVHMLLYEAGEAGRFCEESIEIGVRGSFALCEKLGILEAGERRGRDRGSPVRLRGSRWLRAPRTGLCRHRVSLGDFVEPGQRIASIFDTIRGKESPVHAKGSGYVIGLATAATLYQGDAVCHIAKPES